MDIVDTATRSRMMAGIRGKNTSPELEIRRRLHRRGFRYRLHGKKLPGRPDIVLPKHDAVCFVHGCFWHRHAGCSLCATPSTRPEFWRAKFAENVARDARNHLALRNEGWRVAIVWECSLRKPFLQQSEDALVAWLHSARPLVEIGRHPGMDYLLVRGAAVAEATIGF